MTTKKNTMAAKEIFVQTNEEGKLRDTERNKDTRTTERRIKRKDIR
jgi:hypothetical protein